MLARWICCGIIVSHVSALPKPKAWEPLRELLQGWAFTDDFAVSVGVAHGKEKKELFLHEHGAMTMHTKVGTASTSKWPMAMAMTGAVNDGTIRSLDALVHEYVPWWTKDGKDIRSSVTLRHLLSFTSGFGSGMPGQEGPSNTSCLENASYPNFDECARIIYENVGGPGGRNMSGVPGKTYSYNSYHLQLAAAMVMHASGLGIHGVLHRYLFKAYNMTETSCDGSNPQLAVCLLTTGRDYANFLSGVLGHHPLSRELVHESERDYTPFMSEWYTLYGDYAFGHFLGCFDSVAGFTRECKQAKVHSDPGAFGFYPMIDRQYSYYMELVAFEHTNITYPRSGIPEYLAQLIKPYVDAIMRGEDISFSASHSTPEFMSLTFADINYIADCYIHPAHCAGSVRAENPIALKKSLELQQPSMIV